MYITKKKIVMIGLFVVALMIVLYLFNALLSIQYYSRFPIEEDIGSYKNNEAIEFTCPPYAFIRFALIFPSGFEKNQKIDGTFQISDFSGKKNFTEKFTFSARKKGQQEKMVLDTMFLTPIARELAFTSSFSPILEIGNRYFVSINLTKSEQKAVGVKILGGSYRYLWSWSK